MATDLSTSTSGLGPLPVSWPGAGPIGSNTPAAGSPGAPLGERVTAAGLPPISSLTSGRYIPPPSERQGQSDQALVEGSLTPDQLHAYEDAIGSDPAAREQFFHQAATALRANQLLHSDQPWTQEDRDTVAQFVADQVGEASASGVNVPAPGPEGTNQAALRSYLTSIGVDPAAIDATIESAAGSPQSGFGHTPAASADALAALVLQKLGQAHGKPGGVVGAAPSTAPVAGNALFAPPAAGRSSATGSGSITVRSGVPNFSTVGAAADQVLGHLNVRRAST